MISLGLNLILGVMLFCALVLGLRLERRLRALRQSHMDFAKAVSELDQAALRTEDSLAKLRAGSEAARSELASRIDQARIACQRLETLTAQAEKALERPLPLAQAIAAAAPGRPTAERPTLRPVPAAPRPAPAPAVRSRALIDDELFAAGPEPERRPYLAAVVGGRR